MSTQTRLAPRRFIIDPKKPLADLLARAAQPKVPPSDIDVLRRRLRPVTLMELVAAMEEAQPCTTSAARIVLYRNWIACQAPANPQLHLAWFNLAAACSQARDEPAAILAYQAALALRPDFHFAAANLGTILESAGLPDLALQTWQQSLQDDAARLLLLNNRGRLLEQLGRLAEAEQEMRRSLAIDPRQPDVIQHWVHIRQKMCLWPALSPEIPGLSAADLLHHAGPMATLALTDDIALQCAAGQDWIARKTAPVPQLLCPAEGYVHERLRIGYISSDFCSHAMSYLIAELFERHDRTRFEIFGYCSSPDDNSPIRARVLKSFDHLRRIREVPDAQAAQMVRDDEIDILVDLNGLTSGVRAQLLRHKPAPVQATYLGFVGPVPLPELDYMFCDRTVVPLQAASAYQPTPLPIAATYQANDGKRRIGPAATRAAAGLPEDTFVFCCFSNHYKLTEEMFGAWMQILQRAGDTVLWIVGDNEWARANMLARAAACGIGPERFIFASRVGPDDYMARLRLADAFLDTFPYNAGTIASDAIRMGLPLVTLSGRAFASRMATSLLTAIGAEQGIATSLQGYIDFAVSLANDSAVYDAYMRLFDIATWSATIGDIAGFTRSFEAALIGIAKRGEMPHIQ